MHMHVWCIFNDVYLFICSFTELSVSFGPLQQAQRTVWSTITLQTLSFIQLGINYPVVQDAGIFLVLVW